MKLRAVDRWRGLPANYRYAIGVVVLALIYLIAAKVGLSLAYTTRQVTAVWPPTGIALAALVIFGRRYWPGLFIGALLANLITAETLPVALGIAVGNTMEGVVGAYLLHKLGRFNPELSTIRDVIALFVLAGLGSTLISATIGTGSLLLGHIATIANIRSVWMTWWVGDMMGDLLFAPFFFSLLRGGPRAAVAGKQIEAGLLLAVVVAVSYFCFATNDQTQYSMLYILFPFLVWSAIRFTQVGVVTATMVASVVAIWATTRNLGPFAGSGAIEHGLVQLQLFIFVISSSSLLLAVTIRELSSIQEKLRLQAAELARQHETILKDVEYKQKMEAELKAVNRRLTLLLADVLQIDKPEKQ